jgi:hypothetical protein
MRIAQLIAPLLAALPMAATASDQITWQGRVASPDGTPLATANYRMQFRILASETGGTPLWQQQSLVPIDSGYYAVALGSTEPFPAGLFSDNKALWLEVALDANNNGSFEESETFTPRTPLTAVPYSLDKLGNPSGGTGTIDQLRRTYTIGNGSVDYGKVVSLYGDGLIRQSASYIPYAETEYLVPANAPAQLEAYHYQIIPLGPNHFVANYIRRQTSNPGGAIKQSVQVPVSLSASGAATVGPATIYGGNDGRTPPLALRLTPPATGAGDSSLLLNVSGAVNNDVVLKLTRVDAANPTVVIEGASLAIQARTPARGDMELVAMAPTATHYRALLYLGAEGATGSLSTNNSLRLLTVERSPSGAPETASITMNPSVFGLGPGLLPVSEDRFLVVSTFEYPDALEYRYSYQTLTPSGLIEVGPNQVLNGLVPPYFSATSTGDVPNGVIVRLYPLGGDRALLYFGPTSTLVNHPTQLALLELDPAASSLRVIGTPLELPSGGAAYGSVTVLDSNRFLLASRNIIYAGRVAEDSQLVLTTSGGLPALDMGLGQVGNSIVVLRELGVPSSSTQTLLRVSPLGASFGRPIGLAARGGVAGESIPVVLDGILDGLANLPAGETIYGAPYSNTAGIGAVAEQLRRDGSLTPVPTGVRVGKALSPSELLIRMD